MQVSPDESVVSNGTTNKNTAPSTASYVHSPTSFDFMQGLSPYKGNLFILVAFFYDSHFVSVHFKQST